MQVAITTDGVEELFRAIIALGGEAGQAYFVGVLSDIARVPRRLARQRNYGFTDRTGRLRKTIRQRQRTLRSAPSVLFGERYRQKLVSIYAGGRGARQAYLVEAGHGGPFPARPHPYLGRALEEGRGQMESVLAESARRRFPDAVAKAQLAALRGTGRPGSPYATLGRTVARRGRRRR